MTSSKPKWFREGEKAHEDGWYYHECPYAKGTEHEKDWQEGWMSKEQFRGKCHAKGYNEKGK